MRKKKKESQGLQSVGWRSIEVDIPRYWNLVGESGGRERGHIAFASESYRFEVSWEKTKKRKQFNLKSVTDKLEKKLQKMHKDFRVLSIGSANVSGHHTRYFYYSSNVEGYGIAWYCDIREIIFRVLFNFKSGGHKAAKPILENLQSSLKCHTQKDWSKWAVQGFSLKMPSEFSLINKKILIGSLSLEFYEERPHMFCTERYQATLQYWGPADLYKDYRDLEGWFWNHRREDFRKRYKLKIRRALDFRRVRISGHEGKSFSIPIRRGLLKKEIGQIDSYIWYCPNMSRIHVLTLSKITDEIPFLPAKEYENTPTETFNKILASVSCHSD